MRFGRGGDGENGVSVPRQSHIHPPRRYFIVACNLKDFMSFVSSIIAIIFAVMLSLYYVLQLRMRIADDAMGHPKILPTKLLRKRPAWAKSGKAKKTLKLLEKQLKQAIVSLSPHPPDEIDVPWLIIPLVGKFKICSSFQSHKYRVMARPCNTSAAFQAFSVSFFKIGNCVCPESIFPSPKYRAMAFKTTPRPSFVNRTLSKYQSGGGE
jgi:hypothetical protein